MLFNSSASAQMLFYLKHGLYPNVYPFRSFTESRFCNAGRQRYVPSESGSPIRRSIFSAAEALQQRTQKKRPARTGRPLLSFCTLGYRFSSPVGFGFPAYATLFFRIAIMTLCIIRNRHSIAAMVIPIHQGSSSPAEETMF